MISVDGHSTLLPNIAVLNDLWVATGTLPVRLR